MERPHFVEGYVYHIYNRGVEKRNIFLEDKDRLRFIADLYEFNDTAPVFNPARQPFEVRLQTRRKQTLVEILSFCLMPNHYHLMMRQKEGNGITEFMRKLGTGYTNYFNLKYTRVGSLFQGKFKAILLKQEGHLTHLPHYIHLNPLDITMPEWRKRKIRNPRKIMRILQRYRWSSLPDYLGRKNFPSVISPAFLNECIGGPKDFLRQMSEFIQDANCDFVAEVALE
ncbi:MAG: transposase [Patescibacteria group bacterium]